jgi:hypothetical protein
MAIPGTAATPPCIVSTTKLVAQVVDFPRTIMHSAYSLRLKSESSICMVCQAAHYSISHYHSAWSQLLKGRILNQFSNP